MSKIPDRESCSNEYYLSAYSFEQIFKSCLNEIFTEYPDGLTLSLGNVNLLANPDNCILSSTAIGYCIEEFVFTKINSSLIQKFKENGKTIKISRPINKTQSSSYDFSVEVGNHFYMINIKAARKSGTNHAVAALAALVGDYCLEPPVSPPSQLHYLVVKIFYDVKGDAILHSPGNEGMLTYYLEQVDFTEGFRSDSRN